MTVSVETSKRVYVCDGSTVEFAYPFKIWEDADLSVYLFTIADATTLALRLDVDYTVSDAGEDAGGDVTLTVEVGGDSVFEAAPSALYKLVLMREPEITQDLDLIASGAFSAEAVEKALDRLTYMMQRLDEKINRCYLRDLTQTGEIITDPTSLGYQLTRINLNDGYLSGNLNFQGYYIENITGIKDDDEDTGVYVEYATDEDKVRFYTGGTKRGQFDANGLTLQSGASVNEFSIDGLLAGNSDDAVPTEKAIKTYADALTAVGAAGGDLTGTYPNPTHATAIPKNVQVFTSSGTWTRPAGIDYVLVKVWGGGGGGGGHDATPTYRGSGGGSGGYTEGIVEVTGNVTVTIGAGGTGGTQSDSSQGGTGGTSSFAGETTPQATGGVGGTGGNNTIPGTGGSGSNGTINLTGGTGGVGSTNAAEVAGKGGHPANLQPGGGGSGALAVNTVGTAGGAGMVIVYY